MKPLDLTIAIPVKNEAMNLPGCLEAIGSDLAEKIVVIDSGSTDETVQIAHKYGCEVISFSWNGQFPKKRNWFLRNHTPATKWVLFLDADEYLTENFKRELRDKLPRTTFQGFWLHYSIYFLGRKLKGGYPLAKLALFQVGAGEYERIDENKWSQLDMEIHEHPVIPGKMGEIKSKIDHRDFRGIESYVAKHNEYAAWEASRLKALRHSDIRNTSFTWKQKLKYRLMGTVWIGPVFFIGSFLFMGGFRDGSRGLAFAMLKMAYFAQIYSRLCEKQLIEQRNPLNKVQP